MADSIRIVITDDHYIVREGLQMILSEYPDIEVIGAAENGFQAIQLAGELHPDVILMDLRMPGLDGLTAIERIKARWPEIGVVILTTFNEDELMFHGFRAGAQSFLLKDCGSETLVSAIRAACKGNTVLKKETLGRLFPKSETPWSPVFSFSPKPKPESGLMLSRRELEILQQVATGARNKEIALQLHISQSTVKAHLDSIFNKLGVDSRTAAVSVASQYGLLFDPYAI